MKTAAHVANELRLLADHLDKTSQAITVPVTNTTIAEAVSRIRQLAPAGYRSLRIEIVLYADDEKVEFEICDGKELYRGATLESALNYLLLAHTAKPGKPVELVQRLLDETEPIAF